MNIKEIVNNPKVLQLITTLLTVILGYFGYVEVSEHKASNIDVEVVVPDTKKHKHKDWLPIIKDEIEKARKAHSNTYHGGD